MLIYPGNLFIEVMKFTEAIYYLGSRKQLPSLLNENKIFLCISFLYNVLAFARSFVSGKFGVKMDGTL